MNERTNQLTLLGIRVDDVTFADTLARMEAFIADGKPHQVCTVNPEFIMTAQRDAEFRCILAQSDLNIPDGGFLLWAARRMGRPLRERVTGSDTLPMFAELAARKGYRVFFLGAADSVAERAAQILRVHHPGLNIVGCYGGSPSLSEEDAIVARVRAAQPHALFVAYGAPQQDKWIARNAQRLQVPLLMGVGGTFDFIVGIVPRAPRWMRRLGLEWLYRLARQPWRWRRQLAIWQFAWLTLWGRV
jgi:N-acetylglucosaminyldiphosphoundecaprenol N-acetyl-beta-D-mannosaminyltransferase